MMPQGSGRAYPDERTAAGMALLREIGFEAPTPRFVEAASIVGARLRPSEHGPRSPRSVTDIHGWAPGEFDAYRSILFGMIVRQNRQRQASEPIECGSCGDQTNARMRDEYCCFHCEVVFCASCSRVHFGPPPTPLEIRALQDDAREALSVVMLDA